MPAYNVRFGATAAVTPLKLTCENERWTQQKIKGKTSKAVRIGTFRVI